MMKRTISLILSALLVAMCTVSAFAADTVKFKLALGNETDSEITVIIEYNGGKSFNSLDMELNFNTKKLKVLSGVKSDGLKAFENYVEQSNGASLATPNATSNPIKIGMATTIEFKSVSGNDLFKMTFKKLTSDKITADDFILKSTNCTDSAGNPIAVSITSYLAEDKTVVYDNDSAAGGASSTAKTDADGKADTKKQTESDSTAADDDNELTGGGDGQSILADNDKSSSTSNNSKKIVTIVAIIVCLLLIIAAIVIFVVRSTKDKEAEYDVDPYEKKQGGGKSWKK